MAPRRWADSIEEARESRAIALNLGYRRLRQLPEEVLTLDHLEELLLRDNELSTIPANLSKLPRLRRVVLVGNPIESLPNIPGLFIDGKTYLRCRDRSIRRTSSGFR